MFYTFTDIDGDAIEIEPLRNGNIDICFEDKAGVDYEFLCGEVTPKVAREIGQRLIALADESAPEFGIDFCKTITGAGTGPQDGLRRGANA